ncbi:MAG: DUF6299 family protein [Nocardioides sp.]
MRASRILLAVTVGVGLVPFAAGAAAAAAPGNDEPGGAQVLHLGDTVNEDTTQATTNGGDDTLNTNCGAPATNGSVWFTYSPGSKRDVLLDASASDYEAGLMVFDGTPTAESLFSCGPLELGLRLRPGHTYYIMAFSDDPAVIGGNLTLTLQNAPIPRVHVSVEKKGVAFHGGAAQLHGHYVCRHGEGFADVSAHLRQRAGRLKIQGDSDTGINCDGTRHRWSARVVSPFGTYAAGHGTAKVKIIACGILVCRHTSAKRQVQLHWAPSAGRVRIHHPALAPHGHPHPLFTTHQRWPGR